MKVSKLLLLSVFITAAVLAIVGGVITQVMAANQAAVQASQPSSPTVDPVQATLAAYQQREAVYAQTIEQANQQLEKANSQIKAMQQAAPVKSNDPAPTAAGVALSADKAGQIAQEAAEAGQKLLKQAELVKYEDKVAYEAVFEKGSIYVDAATGQILFNGTVPQTITASTAAQVASDYLKEKDILSVDQITFRGAHLFRVVFKSGMMVYLDLTGQIHYIQKAVPDAPRTFASAGASSGSGAAQSSPSEPGDDGN